MITERNLTYLYVGNVASEVANNTLLDVDSLANGSVAVVDVTSGKGTTGAISAGNSYQIVNKLSDGTIVRSPIFKYGDITGKGKFDFAPALEQVSYLGYNGTTVTGLGTIEKDQGYTITLSMNHTRNVYMQESEKKLISAVGTAAGQGALVKDLVDSFNALFTSYHQATPTVNISRVADGTKAKAHTDAKAFKFTKGSPIVTSVQLDMETAQNVTIANTDVIRVPSTGGTEFSVTAVQNVKNGVYIGEEYYEAGAAATTASAIATSIVAGINAGSSIASAALDGTAGKLRIYYVNGYTGLPPVFLTDVGGSVAVAAVAIENGDDVSTAYLTGGTAGASFTLDTPWNGNTGYVVGTTGTSATELGKAAATVWGLKFTGIPQPFNPQSGSPVQVNFDISSTLEGIVEYKAQAPSAGSGGWQALAELEAYAQGHEVWYKRSAYPTLDYRQEVRKNSGYNVITIACANNYNISTTGTNVTSPYTMTIAVSNSVASYDALDTVFGIS